MFVSSPLPPSSSPPPPSPASPPPAPPSVRRRHLPLLLPHRASLSSLDKSLAEPRRSSSTGSDRPAELASSTSLCRVLADERGPLVMRCESWPGRPPRGGSLRARTWLGLTWPGWRGGGGGGHGGGGSGGWKGLGRRRGYGRGVRADVERSLRGRRGRAVAWRWLCCGGGLNLVVVLTQKKALKSAKQAEELRREVAYRARTDCVYFIENYTAGITLNVRHPIPIKIDFDTHLTVLAIIRQCIEFARLYRSRSSSKANPVSSSAINLP
ncbi:uncharacterized protein A4U43_C06F6180 [Asparagus officinalis]|uniref:Uncharacterized protein n=1 Tax=Asparagus officinalis TaxID=4686 RepID=A0A5P1EP11_ASPOF|nr:uncharacterized protein A4U43_C06F6180 [Asparagus officinalis]